jgi:hypothetical protein
MLKTFQNRVEWQTRAPEPLRAEVNDRLKLIRERMQDYEALALLARPGSRHAAGEYANRIVKKPYLCESRPETFLPETFLKVRQELGEEVNKLARYRKPSDA